MAGKPDEERAAEALTILVTHRWVGSEGRFVQEPAEPYLEMSFALSEVEKELLRSLSKLEAEEILQHLHLLVPDAREMLARDSVARSRSKSTAVNLILNRTRVPDPTLNFILNWTHVSDPAPSIYSLRSTDTRLHASENILNYEVRHLQHDPQADSDDDVPDEILELLEWLAESARQAKGIVADAIQRIEKATAKESNGGKI